MSEFQTGDLFTVDPALYPAACHGQVYQVIKVPTGARQVNYTGKPVRKVGDTWELMPAPGVKARAENMTKVDRDTEPAPYSDGARVATVVEYKPLPDVGALVRIGPSHGNLPAGLFVVLGDSRKPNAVRLAKLGGDGGRYWPSVPVDWCTVIDPARVRIEDES